MVRLGGWRQRVAAAAASVVKGIRSGRAGEEHGGEQGGRLTRRWGKFSDQIFNMGLIKRLWLYGAWGAMLGLGRVWAVSSEWKDLKGASFRGEPVEELGSWLMFRTGAVSSKFVSMRTFAEEDCVRFHQAIASRPARAARWSEGRGQAAGELVGRLEIAERGQLMPFDFSTQPEPELLLVLYGGRRNPDAASPYFLLDNLAPFINRVQHVYPGRVAAVVWAGRQTHLNVKGLPGARTWLVVKSDKQSEIKTVSRFVPGEGFVMVLMTREGIPLIGGPVNNVGEVVNFVDGASDILWQLNPANPSGARDRLHFLRAVRPVEFAAGQADPLLLIDPLRVEALRQRGVKQVDAAFDVRADGKVEQVILLPSSVVPPALVAPLTEALRINTIFAPAILRGQAVPGAYRYGLSVGLDDPKLAADAAWVNGEARVEIPLKSWLVLKPIKVPEQVFSLIDRIGPDGTVMLSAVTAGTGSKVSVASQMNAFNSDWFTDRGAGSVQPIAGEKQAVDGETFIWKKVTPDHGVVDFLGGAGSGSHDYCIGYAWTEFESPNDLAAWMGIGSDDGLRIWVNGEQVNDRWIARTSRLDDDVVPLRLKKGKNQILIKIQNVKGLWSFTCRLRVRGT